MKKNIIITIFNLIFLFISCLHGMRSITRSATPNPYFERLYPSLIKRSFTPPNRRTTPVFLASKYSGRLYFVECSDSDEGERNFSDSDIDRGFEVLLKKIKKLKKKFIEEYGSLKLDFLNKVTVFIYKLETLINIQNSEVQTMFQYLILTDPDIILLMIKKLNLEYLINIDHADIDGNTALFYALRSNQAEIAKWLIDNNANVQWKNNLNEGVFCYLPYIENNEERKGLAKKMGIEN